MYNLFLCTIGFYIFCDLCFKYVTQIQIWSKWNHSPECPAHRLHTAETQPDTTHYISVWWKIKCHRLLFRALSPFYLHPIYFWESGGLLCWQECCFVPVRHLCSEWCVIRKLTVLFFPSSVKWKSCSTSFWTVACVDLETWYCKY